ncbi:unnamed protein product, partial [Rotaria socialis]
MGWTILSIQDSYANFTCYVHMKCDRGSLLLCLDGGEDEKYCLELHMNQCAQNEYQCRNGMCISQVFLLEVGISYSQDYECLDQSDESSEPDTMKRCEDTVCRFPNTLIWCDDDCIPCPTFELNNNYTCIHIHHLNLSYPLDY